MPQGSIIWLCRVCIGDKHKRIALAEAVALRQGTTQPRKPSLLFTGRHKQQGDDGGVSVPLTSPEYVCKCFSRSMQGCVARKRSLLDSETLVGSEDGDLSVLSF
jgi:hypothetical protein